MTEDKAEKIARTAFEGRLDRSGNPMILHTERVARRGENEDERIVGWLHDVVEDTHWTLSDLKSSGFSDEVVEAVDHLSRREGETYRAFIERISGHPLATLVKMNDLADNRGRCDQLGPNEGAGLARRYDRAIKELSPLAEVYRRDRKIKSQNRGR